jgi:hypothetical protein
LTRGYLQKDPDSTTHLAAFWFFAGCYTRGVAQFFVIRFSEVQLFYAFQAA